MFNSLSFSLVSGSHSINPYSLRTRLPITDFSLLLKTISRYTCHYFFFSPRNLISLNPQFILDTEHGMWPNGSETMNHSRLRIHSSSPLSLKSCQLTYLTHTHLLPGAHTHRFLCITGTNPSCHSTWPLFPTVCKLRYLLASRVNHIFPEQHDKHT